MKDAPSSPPDSPVSAAVPGPQTAADADSARSRIENAGLDVIAESERKGRPRDLFMPWFAANISVLGLSWGAWVLGFGLSFAQAVVAGVVGVIVSFLLCGFIAVLGKRGSAPTLALSRAAFGYHGNRLSAAISWMLTVGWETVLCVSASLASATVLQALGWHNELGAQIVGFLLTVGLAASAGILGFDTIMRVQTWITWATGILTVIYLILVSPQIDFGALTALPAGSAAAFIGALVMVATGFGLGWVNAAADYSRYLPRSASTGGVIAWTTIGSSLPVVVLVIAGIMLVGSDPELGTAIDSDPIGALTTILPPWFLIPFAVVAILGLAGGIIMDLYSSGLSLLATGLPVKRHVATSIDATIMTVGTIAVIFGADDFLGPFQGFLTTLGVVIAAWAGVMLAEVCLRRRDYDEAALFTPDGVYGSVNLEAIALVVLGAGVGWGLVVNSAASWLSWQGYLLGPLGGRDGTWAGANLGVLAALLIGLLGHLLLGRRRVRVQERAGERA
ncbi:MAG: cytosine permease [Actinomyces succiniciruminis]|uniref:Purine-cytosine permease-like transporter n=1 Tax=Actinomyces succiniciruminis TaxID=1522002 RepID=A0A1L7RQ96_9ACTO|nr:cytosine permease [Actinomyces succiniciruminis]MBM6978621.1 cytosine permease [Actinomyces succiniciruminis]CED91323.1 Purine-cytosine permease-like transporter [Actinomyces succiniciruminis]